MFKQTKMNNQMRSVIPWKIIKAKGIWMLLSGVGIFIFVVNILNLTLSNGVSNRFTKSELLRNIQLQDFDIARVLPEKLNAASLTSKIVPRNEIQHIAFLKVHKAASSTAQNIFLRFGWNRNLTFVLAPAKNPSGYPNIISLRESLTNSNILPPPPNKHYDILCNHVFYTNEGFSNFMPKDSVFIGIMREPFDLYKSILNYFRPRYIFAKIKSNNPASEFLRDPSKYEPKGRLSASWTNNRMAIEFGFPQATFGKYNQTLVDGYLHKLDKEFKIMLIAEYMEESVIIMRRYLNWQTKDIMFLSLNIARKKNETMLSKAFDRDFYKTYAKLDYALYSYFYKRFREQIRKEGADFDDELLQYKELRKTVGEFCSQTVMSTPMEVLKTAWGEAFTISKDDCKDMKRGEIDFITRIRVRQYGSKDI